MAFFFTHATRSFDDTGIGAISLAVTFLTTVEASSHLSWLRAVRLVVASLATVVAFPGVLSRFGAITRKVTSLATAESVSNFSKQSVKHILSTGVVISSVGTPKASIRAKPIGVARITHTAIITTPSIIPGIIETVLSASICSLGRSGRGVSPTVVRHVFNAEGQACELRIWWKDGVGFEPKKIGD
jgi:hypothetical protein